MALTRPAQEVEEIACAPPRRASAVFEADFRYFNQHLFESTLPPMTVTFSGNPRLRGFFCPASWYGWDQEEIGELSMNPAVLALGAGDSLSVLVHKMCHYWQFGYGTPSLTRYHNREWADKMIEIGLQPAACSTALVLLPGQQVGHSIIAGGRFEQALAALPKPLWPSCVLEQRQLVPQN